MKKRFSKIASVVLAILSVYLIFFAGYMVGKQASLSSFAPDKLVNTSVGKPGEIDFSLFWEAWNKLREKTVLEADTEKMVQGAISGLVSSLGDQYTVYFEPETNKRFKEDIAGEFGGIGIEIIQKNNLPTVVKPLPGSPAEGIGMKAGDIIAEVDGTKTTEILFDETINRIRGEKGTKVKLKVAREGKDDLFEVEVERDTIVVKSVTWEQKEIEGKKIEYVKINQFGSDTEELFNEAVKDIQQKKSDGIIIDLRSNPGGYLETAVNLSSHFVNGVIVSEKGKGGRAKEYKSIGKQDLKGYKLAVLVNGWSASASEIFAGAIQDRGAGKVIGEKTFGKGSVQELIELSDEGAIKVTVADWYTPNGRQISKQGIEPDITVANDEKTEADEQLDRAYEYIRTGK